MDWQKTLVKIGEPSGITDAKKLKIEALEKSKNIYILGISTCCFLPTCDKSNVSMQLSNLSNDGRKQVYPVS